MNIILNFLPNTIVTSSEKIKAKIKLKNRLYKEYIKNGRPEALYYLLQNLTSETSSYISKCKNDYFMSWKKCLVILSVHKVILGYTENFIE